MALIDLLTAQDQQMPENYKHLSVEEMEKRIREIKVEMGTDLFIPGHHYQKDEVIQFADATGDSLQLARLSAQQDAQYIVFCGVHFMAETADILTSDQQKVVLPDMRAGCSMADMADHKQTEEAWDMLQQLFGDTILPLTYVNSTAEIKAFVGKNGGATVTSSNAKKMIQWAFTQKQRLLFLPDQHLGRNTAAALGISINDMAVWNPINSELEYEGRLEDIKVILWKGHCSVHENFTVKNVDYLRKHDPDRKIIVHPECKREVVTRSDLSGSTKYIIDTIEKAEKGTKWAIGTEMNLVNRLIGQHPNKDIISLNPYTCPCLTMNRIDLPHLLWSLEEVVARKNTNQIIVEHQIATLSKQALERMLSLS
ncbi:quinolinate synthetase [Gracilibacillus halophilus YIM-C55.5]|uniref:Quinolinate synthase n=1 Tax=Gracilibacillus halophilus YIM-C55.5 TaxID=1308866 RepID=N4WQ67_9BACI|nr:quinolinate synthase NadA [Gracilibacillus halophilus]ENH96585.1 quinolinate synthetase [Gracilibacillus halophilus YIM-C55.5]